MPVNIRSATLSDLPEIRRLEHAHFSDVAASSRGGYLFDLPGAEALVDEAFGAPRRMYVSVAEDDGNLVGFAAAYPFTLPGEGEIDPRNMLLQFLAVDDSHRRQGIGQRLVEHIESRFEPLRQLVMIAHVPAAQAAFYRQTGWEVMAATAGFAWLPFNDFLRADFPDPHIGFEHLAARVIRPQGIRKWWGFPRLSDSPTSDAIAILEGLIERGDIDLNDLDEGTRTMISISRFERERRGLR